MSTDPYAWDHGFLAPLPDGARKDLLDRFQFRLNQTELMIASRNKRRAFPYRYLMPSLIPNSTGV